MTAQRSDPRPANYKPYSGRLDTTPITLERLHQQDPPPDWTDEDEAEHMKMWRKKGGR